MFKNVFTWKRTFYNDIFYMRVSFPAVVDTPHAKKIVTARGSSRRDRCTDATKKPRAVPRAHGSR